LEGTATFKLVNLSMPDDTRTLHTCII